MNAIFVAGTDTGVGKTVVAGLLARSFSQAGVSVAELKLVETGSRKSKAIYSFRLAASPHLASKVGRRRIDIRKIKSAVKAASRSADMVIVEGTGGLLVPLTQKKLFIDVVRELKLPVLLVAANKLGAINHTLLSIEALRSRKMAVAGIIFNNLRRGENKLVLGDNPEIVKKFCPGIPVYILPYSKTLCFRNDVRRL